MNRIEYMTKLASLLQDIPEVERKDAKIEQPAFCLNRYFHSSRTSVRLGA